jgi:hypothetical protein
MSDFEEQIEEAMKVAKNMMVNMYSDITIPNALAKYCWNFFNALMDEGFSSESAMQILLSLKFPETKKD